MSCFNQINEEMTVALAHEVKNPVSLIKAHIELLELDKKLSGYESNISVIKNELNKISNIVSNFVLFYNPKTNMDNTEKIDIIQIIKETIKCFEIYNQKEIKFYFESSLENREFLINTQNLKMSILFNNIYKNAIEAIKEQGEIITKIYKLNGRKIIEIIDSGEGLSKNLENVYKPFVSNKRDGTGLGIPICQKIMYEIGGKFEIFNNKNKGCTVRLTF